MITENKNIVQGMYTEGFTVKTKNPFNITVSSGTFNIIRYKIDEEAAIDFNVKSFSEFNFDIEPDEEFYVIYDVYLLDKDEDNLYLARTELGDDDVAFYDDEETLLHCILSVQVPPSAKSIDDVNIIVNRIELAVNTDETSSKE